MGAIPFAEGFWGHAHGLSELLDGQSFGGVVADVFDRAQQQRVVGRTFGGGFSRHDSGGRDENRPGWRLIACHDGFEEPGGLEADLSSVDADCSGSQTDAPDPSPIYLKMVLLNPKKGWTSSGLLQYSGIGCSAHLGFRPFA
jgi:hypothetical protein